MAVRTRGEFHREAQSEEKTLSCKRTKGETDDPSCPLRFLGF